MELIIGGMGQGKTEFALRRKMGAAVTDGAVCSINEALTAEVLIHFEKLLYHLLQLGKDPKAFTEQLLCQNREALVVCREVGCGIVPMDAFEREYRETVGRCCCQIAAEADAVIRVFCGIGQWIKGTEERM
jgi:adenosylcobinamide kinase/adenosylcobinamide-phosphate guanylyltransferase